MERSSLLRAKAQAIRRLAAESVLELHRLADEHERRALEIERAAELSWTGTDKPPRQGGRARCLN